MSSDARLEWPATARNREPIHARLGPLLEPCSSVLEIASGSGEHTVHFAAAHPGVTFQPSDIDDAHRASIDAWVTHQGLANVRTALHLDVTAPGWWRSLPVPGPDLVYCANMIHIAPWSACEGLLDGAGEGLPSGGRLVLYGPFLQAGMETAASNLAFDASLKSRDPSWGIRALEDVDAVAHAHGLTREATHAMPANNLFVVYAKDVKDAKDAR